VQGVTYANEEEESGEEVPMEEPSDVLGHKQLLASDKVERLEAVMTMLINMLDEVKEGMKNMVHRDVVEEMLRNMVHKDVVEKSIDRVRQEVGNEDRRGMKSPRVNNAGSTGVRDYSDVIKGRKEGEILVRPNKQQGSEETKKVIKEKVDIRNMQMGITRFKKVNNGAVLIGCETGKDLEVLKEVVENSLGSDFKVVESRPRKPKIKIMNIGKDELEMDDKNLLDAISKQNKIETEKEGFHMRILKRVGSRREAGDSRANRTAKEDGSIIVELDDNTHRLMMKEKKINVGWKKCSIVEHFNVKRCYKCWGFYHIAKDCTREVKCHQCAGNHTADKCKEDKKTCVNCRYNIQKYNIKMSDEHHALSKECPSYQGSAGRTEKDGQ